MLMALNRNGGGGGNTQREGKKNKVKILKGDHRVLTLTSTYQYNCNYMYCAIIFN